MTTLQNLQFQLKRVNKRKAELEKQISEIQNQIQKDKYEFYGLTLDKKYKLTDNYGEYCKSRNMSYNPEWLRRTYHVVYVFDDAVHLQERLNEGGLILFVPFEYLLEDK